MARQIREIEKTSKPTFGHRIERTARTITQRLENKVQDAPLLTSIERDIALTLHHIQDLRNMHEKLRSNLLRLECYIDTEITQREPRIPVYQDDRIAERDMLRGRLLVIEQERRRLSILEHDKIRFLQDRLLSLTSKRYEFTPDAVNSNHHT